MSDLHCVAATADLLGEVPVWCPRSQRLWWVDVLGAALHRLDPATGERRDWRLPFRRLGSIALRRSGGLVLATEQGLYGFDPETERTEFLVLPEAGRPTHRLNDGRCDRAGRFWVGSMSDVDFTPTGRLFRVEPDLAVAPMLDEIIVPNSIAFSPDDRTFYFADTRRYRIWAFDFDLASGALSNRRVFAETGPGPGRPDGSCVDAEGFLWNADYAGGRVVRYAPDGRVDRAIALPVSYPTCVCFGGPGLDVLFITSARFPLTPEEAQREPQAGSLFALETKHRGLPEPTFAG